MDRDLERERNGSLNHSQWPMRPEWNWSQALLAAFGSEAILAESNAKWRRGSSVRPNSEPLASNYRARARLRVRKKDRGDEYEFFCTRRDSDWNKVIAAQFPL